MFKNSPRPSNDPKPHTFDNVTKIATQFGWKVKSIEDHEYPSQKAIDFTSPSGKHTLRLVHESLSAHEGEVKPREEWCGLEMCLPGKALTDLDAASSVISEARRLRDGVLELGRTTLRHWQFSDPRFKVYTNLEERVLVSASFSPTDRSMSRENEQKKWLELFGELTRVMQMLG